MNGLHHRFLRTTRMRATDVFSGSVGASAFFYTISALFGVWAAYDRAIALERLATLSMGLVLMWLLIWQVRRHGLVVLQRLCQACAVLTGALSVYFLLVHDWSAGQQYDFAPFQTFAIALQQMRPSLTLPIGLHENLVANILSTLMPLSAGAIMIVPRADRRWATYAVTAVLVLGLAALTMTFSRGGWSGLAAGFLCASYLYWRTDIGRQSAYRRWLDWLAVSIVITLGVLLGLLLIAPVAKQLEALLPAGSTPVTHLRLWQDSMSLVRDYRYTGSGLGVSAMVYSTYYFLVHVPYLQHAHNLFIQIGVEQGALGMIGFIGLVSTASVVLGQSFYGSTTTRGVAAIGTASLVAMIVHGLTDATLYAGPLALITFLPIGFALSILELERADSRGAQFRASIGGLYSTWEVGRRTLTGIRLLDEVASRVTKQQVMGWLVGAIPTVLAILCMISWPGSISALRANWGAVLQTRAELSTYAWPEWPIQDMVRRTHSVNLGPAAAEYRAALALNPANVTANRRLGQLALSMGQYNVAQRRLEKALAASPSDQTTMQLLGEVYAIQGNVKQSAFLLASTPSELQERLQMRTWWYEYIDAPQEAAWLNTAIEQR